MLPRACEELLTARRAAIATTAAAGLVTAFVSSCTSRRTTALPGSKVSLRSVSEANYNAVIQLDVEPWQGRHVAANAVTLAQAAYEPMSWLRAVYCGETPVGLVLLSTQPGPSSNFLSRLMIDRRFQVCALMNTWLPQCAWSW